VKNSHAIYVCFWLQIVTQTIGLVSNTLVKQDGCSFNAHRWFSRARWAISSILNAIVIYAVIRINAFCDPKMSYLAENECTNDTILNFIFTEMNDFILKAN
jgi:hypothetical protein